MMLKQIDEMLHASPTRVLAAVLNPRAAIATASTGTHGGTRPRSRLEVSQSSAAPTSRVAASVNRMPSCYDASEMFDIMVGRPPPGESVNTSERTEPESNVTPPVSSNTSFGLPARVNRIRYVPGVLVT